MSTEFLPYVSRVDDQRYQAIVLVHDIPDIGRPRLDREMIGEPCASSSDAMHLAIVHAGMMRSSEAANSQGRSAAILQEPDTVRAGIRSA